MEKVNLCLVNCGGYSRDSTKVALHYIQNHHHCRFLVSQSFQDFQPAFAYAYKVAKIGDSLQHCVFHVGDMGYLSQELGFVKALDKYVYYRTLLSYLLRLLPQVRMNCYFAGF